ncbi:MAG: MoaD/ThiS family protein [Deltaproteobacteria bacterium]|nr:MoaD/ThiS family protein [Deltaproteobacteria bacterium]
MRVLLATPLRSYTSGQAAVEADGASVAQLLVALDAAFPGIRFRIVDEQDRIRQHMRIFVNHEAIRDLNTLLNPMDDVQILQALSGGCGAEARNT